MKLNSYYLQAMSSSLKDHVQPPIMESSFVDDFSPLQRVHDNVEQLVVKCSLLYPGHSRCFLQVVCVTKAESDPMTETGLS